MNRRHILIGICILVAMCEIHADIITVENQTNDPVFAALYCAPFFFDGVAHRLQDPIQIEPESQEKKERLGGAFRCNHYLLFSIDKSQLQAKLTSEQFKKINKLHVGVMSLGKLYHHFYIAQDGQELRGYNIISSLYGGKKGVFEAFLHPQRVKKVHKSALVRAYPYGDQKAEVRIGTELCEQEQIYVNKRREHVKKSLEKLLNKKLNGRYVPNIALLNSGGGVRAMIATLGFYRGAEESGLLNSVMYGLGVSGGACILALWMQSKKTLENFQSELRTITNRGFNILYSMSTRENAQIRNAVMDRVALKQPVTLVNFVSAIAAVLYLGPYGVQKNALWLSQICNTESAKKYPFPIFTAINGDYRHEQKDYMPTDWYEFTPYEVGGVGDWLGNVFVPTWAFGRKFFNGVSQTNNPSYDLALLMGIWGSIYAITYAQFYRKLITSFQYFTRFYEMLYQKLIQYDFFRDKRLSIAKVHNFTRGLKISPHKHVQNLLLTDAGPAINLPYPPASGHGARKADILIFLDSSYDIEINGGRDLKRSEMYARRYNLKFPKLPEGQAFIDATKKPIAIFKDENDKEAPVVIYISRIADHEAIKYGDEIPKGFSTNFSTFAFQYSNEDFDALSWVAQQNIQQGIESIKEAVLFKIKQNNGFR